MEIKKVTWRKRNIEFVDATKGWIGKTIDIGTHGYAECTDDKVKYFFTITGKEKKDGQEIFIAVVDTYTPFRTDIHKMKLAIGNSVYIEENEIIGTTEIKTS